MSASEKLKALLDAAVKEEAGIVPVNPEDLGYVQYNKSQAALEDAIADALPQIVAVVEALEANHADAIRPEKGQPFRLPSIRDRSAAALAALDEALS